VKKATGGVVHPADGLSDLVRFCKPDALKASDGDGYYYYNPGYGVGNNNSA
jgi:hypothetical protein